MVRRADRAGSILEDDLFRLACRHLARPVGRQVLREIRLALLTGVPSCQPRPWLAGSLAFVVLEIENLVFAVIDAVRAELAVHRAGLAAFYALAAPLEALRPLACCEALLTAITGPRPGSALGAGIADEVALVHFGAVLGRAGLAARPKRDSARVALLVVAGAFLHLRRGAPRALIDAINIIRSYEEAGASALYALRFPGLEVPVAVRQLLALEAVDSTSEEQVADQEADQGQEEESRYGDASTLAELLVGKILILTGLGFEVLVGSVGEHLSECLGRLQEPRHLL